MVATTTNVNTTTTTTAITTTTTTNWQVLLVYVSGIQRPLIADKTF